MFGSRKKTLRFSLFLVCFSAGSVMTISAQGPGENPVLLFNGKDAKGQGQAIPVGVFRVDGKQIGSESISVVVSTGFVVRFCENAGQNNDGGGSCEEFGPGTHNLTSINFGYIGVRKGVLVTTVSAPTAVKDPVNSTTADPVRAVRTTVAAPVVVYEALNWGGRSQVYQPGMYRSDRGEFGHINDNMAMSVVIAPGFRGKFCSDQGVWARGAGDCEEHDEGKFNLRFATSISFIEVIDLSDKSPADDKLPVSLYEDKDLGGKRQGFDVGTYLASKGEFRKLANDTASSAMVKKGYMASVCPDETPNDKCEEFAAGKHDLKLRHSASYIRVWKTDQ